MAQFAPTVERLEGEVFLVLAFDAEGSSAIRERELDAHLTYVEKHCDDYLICGPLRDPGESALIGSFFLLAAESEAKARQIVDADPYVQSGMYREIRVLSATAAAGRLLNGVIWGSPDDIRGSAS